MISLSLSFHFGFGKIESIWIILFFSKNSSHQTIKSSHNISTPSYEIQIFNLSILSFRLEIINKLSIGLSIIFWIHQVNICHSEAFS
jgi:hypothetical protein